MTRCLENKWIRGIAIWVLAVLAVAFMPIEDHYTKKLTRDVFAGEEAVCLYPGEYELTVDYASPDSPVHIRVMDEKYIHPDNTQGRLVFEETLPATQDQIETIRFEIPEDVTVAKLHFFSEELLDESSTIFGLRIRSVEELYCDKEFYIAVTAVIGLILLIVCMKHSFTRQELLRHLLLLGSVLVASKVLTGDYIPKGHDLMVHFNRIDGLKEGLKAGYFPVRIYPGLMNDYGYAFPTFYPDLFLHIPALLGVCGVSVFTGYKVLIVLIHLGTAYIGDFAFSRLTGSRRVGTIAAVLYTLSLYRLTDVYTRAALGESLALIFLPLWLYGIRELFAGDHRKWIWSVLSLTGLLRSHILTAEMVVIITCIMALVHIRCILNKKRFLTITFAGVCTLGLNASFLLPFLHHMDGNYNVFVETTRRLSERALQVPTILSMISKYAVATEHYPIYHWSLGMPLIFGCVCLVAAAIYHGKERISASAWKALILGTFFVYMSSTWFPWDLVYEIKGIRELTSILQFPWRLLGFASLYLSISAAWGFELVFREVQLKRLFVPMAMAFTIFCAVIHLDQFYENAMPLLYKSSAPFCSIEQVDDLYLMDGKTMGSYYRRNNTIEQDDPAKILEISGYTNRNLRIEFDYRTEEEQWLYLPLVYDKNYRAYNEDGELLPTYVGDAGKVGLYLEAGSGHVSVAYEEHWSYKAASVVQILVVLGMFLIQCGVPFVRFKSKKKI